MQYISDVRRDAGSHIVGAEGDLFVRLCVTQSARSIESCACIVMAFGEKEASNDETFLSPRWQTVQRSTLSLQPAGLTVS